MRILLLFLMLGLQVSAQEISLRKGVVIDSLPVNDTIDESFALFLPMAFENGAKPLPVIFVFDPEGRGKTAAQLFKPAAEDQGYIIASSNNISSENDFQENVRIAARLINGATSRIPMDYSGISAAGFSEGARVASSIPFVYKNIYGVIAVSDHQMNFDLLNDRNKFYFVGMAGEKDFATHSIRRVAEGLDVMNFPVATYFYEGGHEWPNPALISTGVADLTLEAMRRGKRPRDLSLVEKLYKHDFARVNKLMSNGEYVRAYNFMEHLRSKYDELWNISEIKEKQRQLRRSRNYRNQISEMEEMWSKEMRLMEDFIYYFNEDIATANFENLGWWNYQRLQLEELTKGENEPEANMGHRLLSMINELIKSKREELESAENASLESELLANMIQTIFDQTNFDAYKKVISLSSQDRDYSTALFYLEEMLKNGFDDMEALYNIQGTLALRMTPEFNWLVRKYLGSSRYYDVAEE